MKLIGYARVSTIEQANEGLGLDIQSRALSRFCEHSGFKLARIYEDPGVSGAKLKRPGLDEALYALQGGEADGLVVVRLDRLARSLTVQEAILARVWTAGARMFTVDGGEVLQDDPDDPMRTAMRQMVGVFAELERGMIAARLRSGRRVKAENGGYAGGRPPFGYRAEGGELVPDTDEQRALRRARRAHARGQSLRTIGRNLERAGLLPRHAEHWDPSTLRRVLAR